LTKVDFKALKPYIEVRESSEDL